MLLIIIIVFFCTCFAYAGAEVKREENAHKRLESLENEKFEEALRAQISDPGCRQQILNIIQSDLEYIYEQHWQEVFAGRWGSPDIYTEYWDKRENIILILLMSKSGFLPHFLSNYFTLHNCISANAHESLKILRCIEKNITEKKKWTDAKLMQVPEKIHQIKGGKTQRVETDCPLSSKVFWNFHLSDCTNAVSIWDETLEKKCKEYARGPRAEKKINPYEGKLLI